MSYQGYVPRDRRSLTSPSPVLFYAQQRPLSGERPPGPAYNPPPDLAAPVYYNTGPSPNRYTTSGSCPSGMIYSASHIHSNTGGGGGGGNFNTDLEARLAESKRLNGDLNRSIRHAFIRKVFGILVVQLAITFGLALLLSLFLYPRGYVPYPNVFMWIGLGLAFIVIIVLVCVPGVAQRTPWNYICLLTLAVCFGFIFGYLAHSVSHDAFLFAMGITMGAVVLLGLFAIQTKIDFTGMAPYAMIFLLVLLVFGLVAGLTRSRTANLVYGALGALVFCFYLIIDVQMIVGGKHRRFEYGIDDYTFAALSIYLDVINLFSYILLLTNATQ